MSSRRFRSPRLLGLAMLAGCASGPARPDLYDPGRPQADTQTRLIAAEKLYRANDPAFAAERDQLAQDPVAAFWLTRMFVRDVICAREGRAETASEMIRTEPPARIGGSSSGAKTELPKSESAVGVTVGPAPDADELLRQAARIKNPVEARGLAQIDAMGARAVPCLVEDLLDRAGMGRELGIELIGRIGAPALPALSSTLRAGDAKVRRTGVRALAAMEPSPEVLGAARTATSDADFGVRGEAMAVLARGNEADASLVRESAVNDSDKFVRRKAAVALAQRRERASAATLIRFLERCKGERDPEGERAAQEGLARLAGTTGPRTVDAWKGWLSQWDPSAVVNPGKR